MATQPHTQRNVYERGEYDKARGKANEQILAARSRLPGSYFPPSFFFCLTAPRFGASFAVAGAPAFACCVCVFFASAAGAQSLERWGTTWKFKSNPHKPHIGFRMCKSCLIIKIMFILTKVAEKNLFSLGRGSSKTKKKRCHREIIGSREAHTHTQFHSRWRKEPCACAVLRTSLGSWESWRKKSCSLFGAVWSSRSQRIKRKSI